MRSRRWPFVLALVPALASCAVRAPVGGRIVPAPDDLTAATRLDGAIVFVEAAGPFREPPFPGGPDADSIVMVRGRFEPNLSATVAGSRIVLRNEDQVFHSPFSRSPAAPFRGRPLRAGQAREITVRQSGMVRIFCELHGREHADVLVLRHGTWTRADSLGRFRLGQLPRGRYTLHAWHPTLGERTRPLTVSRRGLITLELRY